MKWYGRKRAEKLPHVDKNKIVVIDTETTGITVDNNEILQITVLAGNGQQLYHSYIKPVHRKSWKSAQKIHGISSDMVKDAPTFAEVKGEIQRIFDKADLVVGYNVTFDINFLQAAGIIVGGNTFDVMREFANYRKVVEGTPYRTCKLVECAEYFSYSFAAHDSREDAKATLYCFNQLIDDMRFTCYEPKVVEQERSRKKTRFTLKFPTLKRMHTGTKGLWCVLIGEILFAYTHRCVLIDFEEYITRVGESVMHFNGFSLENLSLAMISLGFLLLIIAVIKMLFAFPRWIMSKFRRILNRFF